LFIQTSAPLTDSTQKLQPLFKMELHRFGPPRTIQIQLPMNI